MRLPFLSGESSLVEPDVIAMPGAKCLMIKLKALSHDKLVTCVANSRCLSIHFTCLLTRSKQVILPLSRIWVRTTCSRQTSLIWWIHLKKLAGLILFRMSNAFIMVNMSSWRSPRRMCWRWRSRRGNIMPTKSARRTLSLGAKTCARAKLSRSVEKRRGWPRRPLKTRRIEGRC